MTIVPSQHSLSLVQEISEKINNQTFHHHFHVLYDIANTFPENYNIKYVEIGCYAGASACLLLQRPNTTVVAIDLGWPIAPEIVTKNVKALNHHKNNFYYINGNSQSVETQSLLKETVEDVDILFIDGDHFYQGVINDFLLYEKMVRAGGYIVFDDYNDLEFSPEVKHAVDDVVKLYGEKYTVIGTLPNHQKARPEEMQNGNVFILRKI